MEVNTKTKTKILINYLYFSSWNFSIINIIDL